MTNHVSVHRMNADEAYASIEGLAEVLIDCVEGGASVSFMLPLPRDKALGFWRGVADGVARGERTLLVATDCAGMVVGTVQVVTDMPENQPHRADISKLLVHRRVRRMGVAHQLMVAAEDEALKLGRSVLVLDTASAEAKRLYERLGWQRVGEVPNYALMPDGEMCATTFFHKQIAAVSNSPA